MAIGRGVLIAAGVLCFGYLLNGFMDRDLDRDADKNPMAAGATGPVIWVLGASLTLALTLGLMAPRVVLLATVISIVSGTVYSSCGRLKRIPVVGTALNISNFLPLMWVGLE